jgi:hypothetical protein
MRECIGMIMVQSANLALRFLLEVGALLGLGAWGFGADRGLVVKLVLGLGAPLLAATVWAMFGAPAAAFKLSGPLHVTLELGIFLVGAAALYASGRPALAAAFALTIVANRTLMYMWGQ